MMECGHSTATAIIIVAIVCLSAIKGSAQDQVHSNYQMTANSNSETIKIGNSKTKNFNIQESNYQPTQYTQVVLNVPKTKVLRKSRPPTVEEFLIKQGIVDIYDDVKRQFGGQVPSSVDHLGRIIQALNPKYISTERIRREVFPDPSDSGVPPPLADFQPQPLELSSTSGSIGAQLDALNERLREQVHWDPSFMDALSNAADEQLSPIQLAYKRLLVCLVQPDLCISPPVKVSSDELEEDSREEDANEGSDESDGMKQWSREQQEQQYIPIQNEYEDVSPQADEVRDQFQREEYSSEKVSPERAFNRYQQDRVNLNEGNVRQSLPNSLRLNDFRKRYSQRRQPPPAVQNFVTPPNRQQPMVPRWQTQRPYLRY